MAVTLRDIAKELNLSHATVSFVLNDRRDVAIPEVTRKRVMEAAQRLGYRPNRAARALALGRTQMIAIWMPTTYNPFYAGALYHIQEVMRDTDYEAIVCQAYFGEAIEDRRERPLDWPVDGVLAVDCALARKDLFGAGTALDTPIVHVGVYVDRGGDHVEVDLAAGVRDAMAHLKAIGRKRIAFVTVRNPVDDRDPRRAAYCDAVELVGNKPEIIECASGNPDVVRDAVSAYIASKGAPDAMLCYNDQLAISANRGARLQGLRVPQDIAVVGCDGLEISAYVEPPLTTIAQPVREMCALGWEFLLNRIRDPKLPPQRATLNPQLIIRESTTGQ
jgi:DNA-binding LacI/PurR family transcriptional regulator